MGSGASMDQNETVVVRNESPTRASRFFCHACGRVFAMNNEGIPNSYNCPQCQSSFLEEVERSSSIVNASILNSTVLTSTILSSNILRARNAVLNNEQSRRLANAAIMLRLLEIQLRDELDTLQNAFNSNVRQLEEKQRPMTIVALQKLCKRALCTEMLCSQPSCPVCSEEFQIGEICTLLPCAHFFHDACVMPWLNAKRNCPMCRHEITESVPTVEELEKFSETELRDKLFAIAVPIVPRDIKKAISRNELANVLHKALLDKKIILDSLEVATAEYGRRQPNRRFRNFPDPVNDTGSVDYENIGRFGSQSEARNTIPSLHRLNYNQLQPIHPSIGQASASSISSQSDQPRSVATVTETELGREFNRESGEIDGIQSLRRSEFFSQNSNNINHSGHPTATIQSPHQMRDLERSSWIDDSRRSRDETDIINRENSDSPGTTDFRTTGIEFDSEIAASHSQGNELMSWSTDIQSPDPSHRRPMSDLD